MTAKKLNSGFFLPFLLAILVAFVAGLILQPYVHTSFSALNKENTKEKDNPVEIPPDLVKISGCIPYEGEHYVKPGDVPHGPFYVIHNGKLIALEYMFEQSDIPGEKYAKMTFPALISDMQKNNLQLKDIVNELQGLSFDLPDANYTFSDLHWTAPHAGQVHPHYDLHFYLVDKEELQQICPESTLQDVLPQELIEEITKSGVPLPKP